MKILIPTCRPKSELAPMLAAIASTTTDCHVIVSGLQASASVNRNRCLECVAVGEVAIMLDDDIEGFYAGWVDDLLSSMEDPQVVAASARLLNPDGSFGQTCSRCYDATPSQIEIKSNGWCVIPTAAIAFRHTGHRYEERYVGSGFEDSDYWAQILRDIPTAKFLQNNVCRLVHRNEMKNQGGNNWVHNKMLYCQRWLARKRQAV